MLAAKKRVKSFAHIQTAANQRELFLPAAKEPEETAQKQKTRLHISHLPRLKSRRPTCCHLTATNRTDAWVSW